MIGAKLPSSKWIILSVMALFYMSHSVHALVMGIDFGVDSFKVVLVRPGSIDIVLNEGSGRKTPNIIGYTTYGRVFGDRASQLYTKNPMLVFNSMNEILGRQATSLDDEWLQEHIHGHHQYWLQNATLDDAVSEGLEGELANHRVLVQVGNQVVFTEEVLAQILAKARQYSTAEAGSPVKDCVISVPFYWSHVQRQALLDAAHLGGLNVLSLINQNMAIAIKFLTDRDFEDGPKNVVFYDMGTSDLQISVYKFDSTKTKGGKVKYINNATLLATAFDASLGGSAFDSIISDMCVDKLRATFGADFQLPAQAMTKLQKQAKKTKEVLSANRETSVTIESLLPDYDFKMVITREEFEKRSAPLFSRGLDTLKQALEAAQVTPEQIDFFELFGGGPRIPKIQEVLKNYLNPIPLSRHLNSDEAAAFGAAIYAASKSSQHRVKEFNIKDGSNAYYPILVRATDANGKSLVDNADETESQEMDKLLYKENSRLGSRKTLKIATDQDIFLELKYPASVQLGKGLSRLIGRYQISFPQDFNTRYNVTGTPQVNIKFELTSSGTVLLTSAEAQVPTVTQKTVKVKLEKVTETTDDSSAQDVNTSSDKPQEEAQSDQEATPSSEQASDIVESSEESVKAEEKVQEETTEIRSVHSKVNVKLSIKKLVQVGLSSSQLQEASHRLKVLDDEEKLRLETERAKSDLESLIYSVYDKLDDSAVSKFSTEAERGALSEALGEQSSWLEEDGADAPKASYLERKGSLSKQWDKITFRISEHTALPKSIESCTQFIELSREAVSKIEETRNVTKEDVDSVLDAIKDVEDFVRKAEETEKGKLAHEDPTITSSKINERCKEFGWRIEFLAKRPRKPKPATENAEPIQTEEPTIKPVTETVEGTPEDLEKAEKEASSSSEQEKNEHNEVKKDEL